MPRRTNCSLVRRDIAAADQHAGQSCLRKYQGLRAENLEAVPVSPLYRTETPDTVCLGPWYTITQISMHRNVEASQTSSRASPQTPSSSTDIPLKGQSIKLYSSLLYPQHSKKNIPQASPAPCLSLSTSTTSMHLRKRLSLRLKAQLSHQGYNLLSSYRPA